VRSIGVCNFSLRMLRELSRAEPPAVLQLEWHPLLQRWHVLRYCREQGIVVQGYGSGGGGWRLWRKRPELELLRRAPMQLAAAAHGKSAHQVCKANVTVSSSIVASNALASNARWQLTRRSQSRPNEYAY
jgi:diketogulonate reductase-like aldo/keto reductase